jgi:GNAT superfamily N-acetyltransferase
VHHVPEGNGMPMSAPDSTLTIRQAEGERDSAHVRELFGAYLQWVNACLNQEYGIDLDIEGMLERDMATLDIFRPPQGRLLLAFDGDQAVGVACMRPILPGIGEIKRMYVRPSLRRRGVGRRLLEAVLREAQAVGYHAMRLDSPRFMVEAHTLYRSAGFREIDEYPEVEIAPQFRKHWVFMEKRLDDDAGSEADDGR